MTNETVAVCAAGLVASMSIIVAGVASGTPEATRLGILGVIMTAGFAAWTTRD